MTEKMRFDHSNKDDPIQCNSPDSLLQLQARLSFFTFRQHDIATLYVDIIIHNYRSDKIAEIQIRGKKNAMCAL